MPRIRAARPRIRGPGLASEAIYTEYDRRGAPRLPFLRTPGTCCIDGCLNGLGGEPAGRTGGGPTAGRAAAAASSASTPVGQTSLYAAAWADTFAASISRTAVAKLLSDGRKAWKA